MEGCLVPNAPITDRAPLLPSGTAGEGRPGVLQHLQVTGLRRFLIWLAAGWGLTIVAHLVHVDWLLLVTILVLTAALIRGGHSLLDRLMVALLLLLGAGITAGLLFTFWPWGLAPVPIAGLAFSALGLINVFGGRDLQLPRPTLADGAVAGAALVVAGYFARPFLRTSDLGRLSLLMTGGDNARHLGDFDSIGRVGGYLFWQSPSEMPNVFPGLEHYPQGFHFTAALLDAFVRSSSAPADMATTVNHYLGFVIAAYGLLALTLVWGARWIAGPLLSGWRVFPIAAVLVGILCFGEFPDMVTSGFASEMFGLALVAGLIAVIARGPGPLKEQVVLLSLLLVAIGFSYQLFLPAAGLAVVGWLVTHRRSVRPLLPFVAIFAVAAALSALPTVTAFGVSNIQKAVAADGWILHANKHQFLALAAFVVALMLTPAARRLRVWRGYFLGLLAVACLPIGIGIDLVLLKAPATYYYEKAIALTSVVLLLGIGAVALLLPAPRRRPTLLVNRAVSASWPAGGWRQSAKTLVRRASAPVTALLLVVSAGAFLGFAGLNAPYRPMEAAMAPGRFWSREAVNAHGGMAALVIRMAGQVPAEPGVVNVVISKDQESSHFETSFLSMYQRSQRSVDGALLFAVLKEGPREVGAAAAARNQRIRFIALDVTGVRFAQEVEAVYPGLVAGIQTWPAPGA
jgi:hypothetical protein